MQVTDSAYMPAETDTSGGKFIRKMATYGQGRPMPAFTSKGRAANVFVGDNCCLDMSDYPPELMDPRDPPDLREGALDDIEAYQPPPLVESDFIKGYENYGLMLPSERFQEHLAMKDGERKWHAQREKAFEYTKRMRLLHSHHEGGVMGIDGPMHPDTKLFATQRDVIDAKRDVTARHQQMRHERLTEKRSKADESITFENYATPVVPYIRSADIAVPRRRVDPNHSFRFIGTHDRIFPNAAPLWDPERAKSLISHETRGRDHDLITGLHKDLGPLLITREYRGNGEGPLTTRSCPGVPEV